MSVGAVNKQTGDRIPTAGMPAIDDALDLTSVNPVQNAIVTAALANKQNATDNNLQTTDKTVVGAINEHEGDIDSLKSGLTNVQTRLEDAEESALANRAAIANDGAGINLLDIGNSLSDWGASNSDGTTIIDFDITTRVTGSVNKSAGTITITDYNTDGYVWMAKFLDLKKNTEYKSLINFAATFKIMGCNSKDPCTVGTQITTNGEYTFNSGNYDYWFLTIYPGRFDTISNLMIKQIYVPNNTYVPYIPSVESRIEAVESGLDTVKNGLTNVADDVKLNTQDLTTPSRTVNLYNKNDEYLLAYINTDNGVLYESTGATVVWIKCKPNTTYTVSKQARTNFMVATTRVKPAVGVQTYGYIVDYGGSSITITTDANAVYLVAYVYANSDQPTTREEMLATVQIEEGSTATSYTPYIPSVESRIEAVESGLTNVTPDIKTVTASPDTNGFINLSTYGYSKNSHKYVNAVVVDNNYNIKMWKHSSYGWIVTLYTAETFTRVTDTTVSVDLVVFGIKA